MVAKPLCPLYKNIIQPLDRARYPELRSSMFKNCRSLQVLNISGWDLTNTTETDDMFSKCSSLKTIYMRNCSQATIDKIKAQLETDGILNNVTIITE